VKVAVLPLSRNEKLSPKAASLATRLRKRWIVEFDDARAIGRRYRRQDEIGTPFCVTVDFDTLDDQAVTVRDRDSMKQERVSLDRLEATSSRGCPAADALSHVDDVGNCPHRPQWTKPGSWHSCTERTGRATSGQRGLRSARGPRPIAETG
jgi:hypothetical protein